VVSGVDITLGIAPVDACTAYNAESGGLVTVDKLVRAVQSALGGCR